MKIAHRLRGWLVVPLVVTACASAGATPVTVDPRVEREVGLGRARVLVEVRPPITRAQDDILARLAGTDFRLVRRFESSPLLALEIGPSALAALRAMGDVVVRVTPDTVIPPAGEPTPRR